MSLKNQDFLNYLDELYPNAHCELNYRNVFTLLMAVMLSAQTTDNAVNKVTPLLFDKYDTPNKLASAKQQDIESIIKPLGLYKNKANNLIGCAKELVSKYNGEVPNTLEELMSLKGVGRKTASVVLIEGFKIPAFPVDTHIERISKRLGLADKNDDATTIDNKLRARFDSSLWSKLHHQIIFFGRYKCKAKNPLCDDCKLKNYCLENKSDQL